jgi:hypothetical protein
MSKDIRTFSSDDFRLPKRLEEEENRRKKPLNTLAECLSVNRQEAATGDRHRRSHECNGYGSWKQIDGLLMSG